MSLEDNVRNNVIHFVAERRRNGENDRHAFKKKGLGYSFIKLS